MFLLRYYHKLITELIHVVKKLLTKNNNRCIIKIGKRETTNVVCQFSMKKHTEPPSYRCVFLFINLFA